MLVPSGVGRASAALGPRSGPSAARPGPQPSKVCGPVSYLGPGAKAPGPSGPARRRLKFGPAPRRRLYPPRQGQDKRAQGPGLDWAGCQRHCATLPGGGTPWAVRWAAPTPVGLVGGGKAAACKASQAPQELFSSGGGCSRGALLGFATRSVRVGFSPAAPRPAAPAGGSRGRKAGFGLGAAFLSPLRIGGLEYVRRP